MRKSCELMSSRSCSPSSTCETGCALLCEAERYLATPTRAAITRRRATPHSSSSSAMPLDGGSSVPNVDVESSLEARN
eukprot:CAMPEP_0182813904 /NCGR_PEP_ID=MMETSP0006_2-20121128/9576_1 /TAXON_ID=97485 /ORGANISM="Prymnesium parvum, Strain Texoma1" /LENGTH=77 /DNA_ID=CAMNT_0024940007 /DNA_START=342 /DNA_END=575 /DNA_ORIENTATION=+